MTRVLSPRARAKRSPFEQREIAPLLSERMPPKSGAARSDMVVKMVPFEEGEIASSACGLLAMTRRVSFQLEWRDSPWINSQ